MAKTSYTCQSCGTSHPKWSGRCDACGEWNALVEEKPLAAGPPGKGLGNRKGARITLSDLATDEAPAPRSLSGIGEFDRVTGGGLVPASVTLVGGDPGIGKSTLLLQAAAAFGTKGDKVIYVSGEEATGQVRLRARRLGLAEAPVSLAAETNLRNILTTLEAERPALVVIDSIQTMWLDTVESAPGSVAQVRASAHELVTFAKRRGIAVILVGHVTKEGQIAGPRVVEHMVDTVLYFEGARGEQFRILRAVKNRFGPADEIGVFEMTGAGLAEVTNPSALFLSERDTPSAGSVVYAGIEGTRPLLVELQALVAPSPLGTPRRTVVGWDGGRLAMILAVLEARAGIGFANMDVYLNVAGGLRITEPAADLAVAAALLSARFDMALPVETVIFGEVSLSGALRPAAHTSLRLKEATKLGFQRAFLPNRPEEPTKYGNIGLNRHEDLTSFAERCFGPGVNEGGQMDLESINIVDAAVLIILLISAVLAFSRGFVREILSIAGWVIAALAAFTFAPQVEPLIREIPGVSSVLGTSCSNLSILVACAAVFAITLVIVSIFTPLFSGLVSNSALGPIDQGLGFLFGVARGILLVAVALIAYDIWTGEGEGVAQVETSQTRVVLDDFTTNLQSQIPTDAPGWITQQYERLTGSCG